MHNCYNGITKIVFASTHIYIQTQRTDRYIFHLQGMSEKMSKQVEMQMAELNDKIDQSSRTIVELNSTKSRLQMESTELTRQLEDAESRVSQLNKERQSLLSQLDEAKKSLEDETRVSRAVYYPGIKT